MPPMFFEIVYVLILLIGILVVLKSRGRNLNSVPKQLSLYYG